MDSRRIARELDALTTGRVLAGCWLRLARSLLSVSALDWCVRRWGGRGLLMILSVRWLRPKRLRSCAMCSTRYMRGFDDD